MRYDECFAERGYHTALLTTFAFDPWVFENMLLLRLNMAGCRNIGVIADERMSNRHFAELGSPKRAGKSYSFAKRRVNGAFHPKILLQFGETKSRLIVGSANLTGPGLQGNLEILDEVTLSEGDKGAGGLIVAALRYFEDHVAASDLAMQETLDRLHAWCPWLRDTPPSNLAETPTGPVWFLTEREGGIAAGFRAVIGDDWIERIVCLSPFQDPNLAAVERLRQELGHPATDLVVDARGQDFPASVLEATEGLVVRDASVINKAGKRPLHAKLIVAEGGRADYVLAGSANMTQAGLYGGAGAGNAESCLLRREPKGTAVSRLGLEACLAQPWGGEFRLRRSDGMVSDSSASAAPVIDGGSLMLRGEMLIWAPPTGHTGTGVEIELHADERLIAVLPTAQRPDGTWFSDRGEGLTACQFGIVDFGNGRKSAPVPVAMPDLLRQVSRRSVGGRPRRLLEELHAFDDIDDQFLGLMLQLVTIQTVPEPGARAAAPRDRAEADAGEVVSAEEFGRYDVSSAERRGQAGMVYQETRAILNRALGRDVVDLSLDQDDGLDGELGTQGNAGAGKVRLGPKVPRVPRKRRALTLQKANLLRELEAVRCFLRGPDLDALSLPCLQIVLTAAISILRVSIPVGADPKDGQHRDNGRYLQAKGKQDSWVRMIGLLLFAWFEKAAQSVPEKTEALVEALAFLQTSAMIAHEAAQNAALGPQVQGALGKMLGGISRLITAQIVGDEILTRLTEACVQDFSRKLDHLLFTHKLPLEATPPLRRTQVRVEPIR